jgi:DNA invertase Pin-like site-specific DNA recombinase
MEISRLARDVRHLLNLLHELEQIGVSVISIREGIEFQSVMGKALVAMIGIFMSVERDLLRERIRTALATKKLAAQQTGNGWRCGRKPVDTAKVTLTRQLLAQNKSIREVAKIVGLGKSTVERIKKGQR